MGKSFIKKDSSKYIQYLDANNLYGWAMSRSLPKYDFKWMEEDEKKKKKQLEKLFLYFGG